MWLDMVRGFGVAMGLIVAIGGQNAWVLSMSVRRIFPWSIAMACFSLDAFLMAVGTAFFQQIQRWLPSIVPLFTWIGVAILLWLASQAALRAWRGGVGLDVKSDSGQWTRKKAIGFVLGLSLLNPHVYLDTVILVGSIANAAEFSWFFWCGAAVSSVVWFSSLAAVGKPLQRWLNSPTRWRVFDGLMAVIMLWVAVGLYQLV